MADIAVAFSLLSRLPVPLTPETAAARATHAVWAYPIVGAVLGALSSGLALAFFHSGIAGGPAAALVLLAMALLTGGLHEDGLGDSADGLFGGRDKAHALEIMRDSRVGAYAVIALVLILLTAWSALSDIITSGAFIATFTFAAMMSRATMGLAMHLMPPARADGLSVLTGQPSLTTALIGIALSLGAGWMLLGINALWLTLAGFAVASLLWQLALRKIGGQTGDILGATQKLSETAMLVLATALMASERQRRSDPI